MLELNPRFGGCFPFSYDAGVNLPLAIIKWLRGEEVDASLLQPEYEKMFSKNDYLMHIDNCLGGGKTLGRRTTTRSLFIPKVA